MEKREKTEKKRKKRKKEKENKFRLVVGRWQCTFRVLEQFWLDLHQPRNDRRMCTSWSGWTAFRRGWFVRVSSAVFCFVACLIVCIVLCSCCAQYTLKQFRIVWLICWCFLFFIFAFTQANQAANFEFRDQMMVCRDFHSNSRESRHITKKENRENSHFVSNTAIFV